MYKILILSLQRIHVFTYYVVLVMDFSSDFLFVILMSFSCYGTPQHEYQYIFPFRYLDYVILLLDLDMTQLLMTIRYLQFTTANHKHNVEF
ncbi:hypothetical protein RDI58_013975 [Solanum bulbocastanum]|uniref:Uncharacterized protein n=1 Tax=Solanum bulbocastanum TaxID=147425 RepID=A0AAN8TLY7_SOLBU